MKGLVSERATSGPVGKEVSSVGGWDDLAAVRLLTARPGRVMLVARWHTQVSVKGQLQKRSVLCV